MDIITSSTTSASLVPADLIEKAKSYARRSKSPATVRMYSAVLKSFSSWAEVRGLAYLPATPEIIVAYIADQADRIKPQTIKKHLAAISQAHKLRGFASPVQTEPVRLVMQGLRRVKGIGAKPKTALRVEHIKKMLNVMPETLVGIRDKAILLLGFVAGMRRSEIVALNLDDLAFAPEGLVVTIQRSKRDQEGRGRQVAVPRGHHQETCAVQAVRRWLDESGLQEGPLFIRLDRGAGGQRLSDKSVALVVKKHAARAGLDPSFFSGHSLRRGFCTECARAGALERDIARSTGHASIQVLRGYCEAGTMFESAAAKVLDL